MSKSLCDRLMVKPGDRVRLADIKPDSTPGFEDSGDRDRDRGASEADLAGQIERLAHLQYNLFAENRRSLLIVLQAMDTGGKDGVIRHVFTGLNPQGCRVSTFKQPSVEELDHDFLWRVHKRVPPRGEIGVFNRSHYEDVLIVRVHSLVPEEDWKRRYDTINAFEELLARDHTTVIHATSKIAKLIQEDRSVYNLVQELTARIKQPR